MTDLSAFQLMLDTPEEDPDVVRRVVLMALDKIGSAQDAEQGEDVAFEGDKFCIPQTYSENLEGAIEYLKEMAEQNKVTHTFTRTFPYRPDDVANAFYVTMRRMFGTTGTGLDTVIENQHGGAPRIVKPGFRTIEVGYRESVQIPQGKIGFAPLEAEFDVSSAYDAETGWIGAIVATAPKGRINQIHGFFEVLEDELRRRSIYKGRAITGGDDPKFLDPDAVDPDRIFYSKQTMTELQEHLWGPIEHADLLRNEVGLPFRRSILLAGPYGNGKSVAAAITARKCVENGITFIQSRPGDNLLLTLQLAGLYAPALVFSEDVDVIGEAGEPQQASLLLDAFDGIGAKGREVMIVMTTNHPDDIQQGMYRPGRIDAIVHVNNMDAETCRRLIESYAKKIDLIGVDWDVVTEAFSGFSSAFVVEGVTRALRGATLANGARPEFLTTAHFTAAAASLQEQRERMERATAVVKRPTLDAAVRQFIRDSQEGLGLAYTRSDYAYEIEAPENQ